MSFSPYRTMITVCVCFNSRVQLTVPSFTAWLRSRYSKTLFIGLRWPAQEKDKGVCQGCHLIKKWAVWAGFLGRAAAPAPGPCLPRSPPHSILQAGLLNPHPTPGGSPGCHKLHRSWNQKDGVPVLALLLSSCVWPGIQPPQPENRSFNTHLSGLL